MKNNINPEICSKAIRLPLIPRKTPKRFNKINDQLSVLSINNLLFSNFLKST